MFDETIELRDRVDPERLRKTSVTKIELGMARAADVIGGFLREYSGMAGGPLRGRTGSLTRAWLLERVEGEPLTWRFRNRMVYSSILEFGGTIRPTRAGALAIPLPGGPAVTERGVGRFTSPRATGHDLFVFKSKASGQAFLAEKAGRGGGSLTMWYLLSKGVTIPAFRYATKAVEAAKDKAVAEVKRALKE